MNTKYANKIRGRLLSNLTKPEQKFKQFLKSKGFKYELQKIIWLDKSFCVVDFYFEHEGKKIALELDGNYHTTVKGKRRDKYKSRELAKLGIDVIHFYNHDVNKDPEFILFHLKKELGIIKWGVH